MSVIAVMIFVFIIVCLKIVLQALVKYTSHVIIIVKIVQTYSPTQGNVQFDRKKLEKTLI